MVMKTLMSYRLASSTTAMESMILFLRSTTSWSMTPHSTPRPMTTPSQFSEGHSTSYTHGIDPQN